MLVLVLVSEELDWKEAIKRILICGVFWTLGYGIMWASKWILASIILNQNVLKNASEAIQSRSSNTLGSGDEIPINALINSIFQRYHNHITTSSVWINMIFSVATYFLFKFKDKIIKPKNEVLEKETKKVKKHYLKNEKFKTKANKILPTIINTLPIMAVGMLPFVWYYALTNHSYVHTFFTFRTLVVFWFALFITLFKIAKDLNKNT